MITLAAQTTGEGSGIYASVMSFAENPPSWVVSLLVVAFVAWAFRHVTEPLAQRIRFGNGANISVMLCMSLMWVYGFLEASIRHTLQHESAPAEWLDRPLTTAVVGSTFMLLAMLLYSIGKKNNQ